MSDCATGPVYAMVPVGKTGSGNAIRSVTVPSGRKNFTNLVPWTIRVTANLAAFEVAGIFYIALSFVVGALGVGAQWATAIWESFTGRDH